MPLLYHRFLACQHFFSKNIKIFYKRFFSFFSENSRKGLDKSTNICYNFCGVGFGETNKKPPPFGGGFPVNPNRHHHRLARRATRRKSRKHPWSHMRSRLRRCGYCQTIVPDNSCKSEPCMPLFFPFVEVSFSALII